MGMSSSLLSGLNSDQEVDIKMSYKQALVFRKAMVKHLTHKIDIKRKKSCSEDFHKDGDFALKMADTMGYERAQREFINTLTEKV